MVCKLLAWLALATAILASILALVSIFAFGREPVEPPALGTARALGWWGAVPLLVISLLLVVALLVVTALSSDGDS
jgi:hypothetical protein